MTRAVVSRRGADRLRAGHVWIYRSDVDECSAEPGAIVRVDTERGRPLGWAFWSTTSQIALRMLSRDAAPPEPRALVAERLRSAAEYRRSLDIDATAWRLVSADPDGLPATVVDRYGDESGTYFVVQTLAQGAERLLGELTRALAEQFGPRGILARNDAKVRRLEGLETQIEVLHGEVPGRIRVREGTVRYAVDLHGGQKTGLFLDQRENHAAAARYAHGDVLDAFTYNGGFALQMAPRAARVLALDASAAAVATTRENADVNGLTNVEVRETNVFDELRELEIAGAAFETIALDPPAFAKNRAALDRAVAGYKEINLRALRLLRPGGHLITCSCSYHVDETLLVDIVRDAAADARASIWLVEKRTQARDHPILVGVPETAYLKCLILRKMA
jgi:23S rRNA (cytosine1962-C5)-methyltransferase